MSTNIFNVPDAPADYNLAGKKIMVHDLTQPAASSTKRVDAEKFVTIPFIPTPVISLQGTDSITGIPNVVAHYLPCDEKFLSFNPEYFLFRWKGKKKKGFKHPSHRNGIKYSTGKWFRGRHDFSNGQDGGPPEEGYPVSSVPFYRNTEWTLEGGTYKRTLLQGLTPQAYVINEDGDGMGINLPLPLTGFSGYETQRGIRFTGQKKQTYSTGYNSNGVLTAGSSRKMKVMPFKLAVAIDNPNYTPDNGQCPKIFGEMSETFCFYLEFFHGRGALAGNNPQHTGLITAWRCRVHNAYLRK